MTNLPQFLLQALKQMSEHKISKTTLLEQLRMAGDVGDQEYDAALRLLKTRGLADYEVNDLTQDQDWFITKAGLARFRR